MEETHLSRLPWLIGPVVVTARASIAGRKFPGDNTGVATPLAVPNMGVSSLAEERISLPFSNKAPPKVAHFNIV